MKASRRRFASTTCARGMAANGGTRHGDTEGGGGGSGQIEERDNPSGGLSLGRKARDLG
jgi:hypothetical protein